MFNKDESYHRLLDHCPSTGKYREVAYKICNSRCKISEEIPVVIHNGSNYDYHFKIKELAEESKGQFEYLRENTEKYITFPVPVQKINRNNKTMTYKIKFIEGIRFMAGQLAAKFLRNCKSSFD